MNGKELKRMRKRILHMTRGQLAIALGLTAISGSGRLQRYEERGDPIPEDFVRRVRQLARGTPTP